MSLHAIAPQPSSDTKPEEIQPAAPPTRFIARQPILNIQRSVVGYELLFRAGWENCFSGDSDSATRKTLDNCLTMSIESLTNNGVAFVNCTRESLLNKMVTLLPPATTVLEILETIEPDAELIKACRELRDMGYLLALDDFLPRPEMLPLVDMASYIKVDFRLSDTNDRREIHNMLNSSRARGGRAALLAEKVEDQHEFRIALAEGYEYFQGYFFCRPEIISEREIPTNRMHYMRLMVELTKSPLDLPVIAGIVQSEASLCFRLLRLANSAMMATRMSINSVQHAMIVVGEDRLRMLISVAAASDLGHDQPQALISLALQRAHFCELLAPFVGQNPTEQYMLGLLSLVDAILQVPMESILKSLPLSKKAKAALLGGADPASLQNNPVAVPLNLIKCFELGIWGKCATTAKNFSLSEESLSRLYLESVEWAAKALASS